jgi:hypothetical protein
LGGKDRFKLGEEALELRHQLAIGGHLFGFKDEAFLAVALDRQRNLAVEQIASGAEAPPAPLGSWLQQRHTIVLFDAQVPLEGRKRPQRETFRHQLFEKLHVEYSIPCGRLRLYCGHLEERNGPAERFADEGSASRSLVRAS